MSPLMTLVCPDCGYHKVCNCRGYCRCGNYLVGCWQGMNRGFRLSLPSGVRVWLRQADGTYEMIREAA